MLDSLRIASAQVRRVGAADQGTLKICSKQG